MGARLQELGPRFTLKLSAAYRCAGHALEVPCMKSDGALSETREQSSSPGQGTCSGSSIEGGSWRGGQAGTFDSKEGEFEFVHKPKMNVNRRRFLL